MYFKLFKLQYRGRRSAERRRHNCAVLPYVRIKKQSLFLFENG